MRATFRVRLLAAAMAGGLFSLGNLAPVRAQESAPEPGQPATLEAEGTSSPSTQDPAKEQEQEQVQEQIPAISLFDGLRSGELAVKAEGRDDGDMTISVTNTGRRKLRVVLPPGIVATGATGQFGGMGGMGGGGMGGGGMGGGMGGMGGGGMGGMGGGGMGGMGGGGMGGMGGGGMMGGGGVMPASMGMMMLGMMIMQLVGDLDSWDPSSLMMGGMGMMGGGMGGMGGGMGGMGGGMGGMGGGMGGMGGGMGGGFRSIPPTDLPHATVQPGQTRDLSTRAVSLSAPVNGRAVLPTKGEPLQIGDISQLTDDSRLQLALRRLAVDKAPESVTQLVLWHVQFNADWRLLAQLSRGWANEYELALAKQFVERINGPQNELPPIAAASLYLDIEGQGPLADSLRKALDQSYTIGLTVEMGVPAKPEGPALACKARVVDDTIEALVYASDASGTAWAPMGKFSLPVEAEIEADEVADSLAEGILGRLVRAQLIKGKKVKGKDTFKVRVDNASPLILNALAISGPDLGEESNGSLLPGIAIPPRRSMTLPATPELVERFGLESGVRVVLADLSGL